jgi:putative transcriptional regulator
MLRFRLQELIAEKQFQDGKRVTLTVISKATKINRVTLSKMANQRGYSTVTKNLDRLCSYFGCRIEQLVEHIPDEMPSEKQSSQIDLCCQS